MTDAPTRLAAAIASCPLVAVLRGITPDEVEAVGDALVESGFSMLEVPLNSPDPYDSIARLSRRHGGSVLVGAGTVLTEEEVTRVAAAGGALIISPNTNPGVITASAAAGLVSLPGYFTPSEAFAALRAGAHGLKLFPAEGATPALLRAQRAVLPKSTRIFVVGGISPDTLTEWWQAGADGFGLGSNLYRAGKAVAEVARDASRFVEAVRKLQGSD